MLIGLGLSLPRSGLSLPAIVNKVLWTPAALGSALAMWIDPSDSSTITFNSGNIASIASKGGTGVTWSQTTAANQPGNTGNAINFGSTTWLVPSTVPAGAYDAIFTGKPRSQASGGYRVLLRTSTVQYDYLINTGTINVGVYAGANYQYGSQTWDAIAGTAHVVVASANGLASASRDGGALASSGQSPSSQFTAIGNEPANGTFGWGDLYEFVLSNRTLTQSEYQQCEGYAAWHRSRLGDPSLVNALVTGHPYKSSPPYM